MTDQPRPQNGLIVHPGAILREDYLAASNTSPHDFARATGIPLTTLNAILEEREPINFALALKCVKEFGGGDSDAEMLVRIQEKYNLNKPQTKGVNAGRAAIVKYLDQSVKDLLQADTDALHRHVALTNIPEKIHERLVNPRELEGQDNQAIEKVHRDHWELSPERKAVVALDLTPELEARILAGEFKGQAWPAQQGQLKTWGDQVVTHKDIGLGYLLQGEPGATASSPAMDALKTFSAIPQQRLSAPDSQSVPERDDRNEWIGDTPPIPEIVRRLNLFIASDGPLTCTRVEDIDITRTYPEGSTIAPGGKWIKNDLHSQVVDYVTTQPYWKNTDDARGVALSPHQPTKKVSPVETTAPIEFVAPKEEPPARRSHMPMLPPYERALGGDLPDPPITVSEMQRYAVKAMRQGIDHVLHPGLYIGNDEPTRIVKHLCAAAKLTDNCYQYVPEEQRADAQEPSVRDDISQQELRAMVAQADRTLRAMILLAQHGGMSDEDLSEVTAFTPKALSNMHWRAATKQQPEADHSIDLYEFGVMDQSATPKPSRRDELNEAKRGQESTSTYAEMFEARMPAAPNLPEPNEQGYYTFDQVVLLVGKTQRETAAFFVARQGEELERNRTLARTGVLPKGH